MKPKLCKIGIHLDKYKKERRPQMVIPPFWNMSELYCTNCKKVLKYGNEDEMKIVSGGIKSRVRL